MSQTKSVAWDAFGFNKMKLLRVHVNIPKAAIILKKNEMCILSWNVPPKGWIVNIDMTFFLVIFYWLWIPIDKNSLFFHHTNSPHQRRYFFFVESFTERIFNRKLLSRIELETVWLRIKRNYHCAKGAKCTGLGEDWTRDLMITNHPQLPLCYETNK